MESLKGLDNPEKKSHRKILKTHEVMWLSKKSSHFFISRSFISLCWSQLNGFPHEDKTSSSKNEDFESHHRSDNGM